ncbi:MAG: hypothetical protein ACREIT_05630 [Tepidisphaeraceae bacterium]
MMIGAVASIAMLVAALWAWHEAPALVEETARPEVTVWAVRSAAIALAAGAHALAIGTVVQCVYRHDLFGDVLRLSAALVFTLALASAIALGFVGR